jgi:glycerophosphodiester phosphodiesterase
MEAFQSAKTCGADFVEFDIQLTSDAVPVIYHDMIGIITKDPLSTIEPHEITKDGSYRYVINQFTEAEFRKTGLFTDYQTERSSFADLLQKLPISLGFDVELKYPAPYKLNDRIPYFEMNQFVDHILDVMVKYAGNRHIFFSSFDPFVCAMLTIKQTRWPVMQLFNSKKRWGGIEVMTAKVNSLVTLHKELGIQGFVFDCEHLLEVPELISTLKENGFMLCTYGGLNNSAEGIRKQMELGISGLCTDRVSLCRAAVDEYVQEH